MAAENLFLRKQLACYIERRVRPRRTNNASRIAFVLLSRVVEWRELLTIVRHTWGEERIAAELRVKLGLTLSPRTVSRYMPSRPRSRGGRSAQSWATFLHNHAGVVLASDFFIVVTATFQRLYVFVMLDIGTRRVVHWNLTDHPTAAWTTQQVRNGLPLDSGKS